MKSLVIAEKPSVARDIARVLGANQKNGGILEGKNYVVTWALGHLVTLADPEEYDRKYEKWEMATLPMLPKEMKLVVIRQTGRQFSVVKTQLFRKDIGEIQRPAFLWQGADPNPCHDRKARRRNPQICSQRILWYFSGDPGCEMDLER